MIDLKRRSFLFGAAATLILPPARTFHILDGSHSLLLRPQGLILPGGKLFDLPDPQSESIGRKLIDGTYKMRDIPSWVVLDQHWYKQMIALQRNEPDSPPTKWTRTYDL